jgi:alcohol dehydrogenase class IV
VLCCQGYPFVAGGETAFQVDAARVIYGSGALRETGLAAKDLGMTRVALFTDAGVARLEPVATVSAALRAAGLDVALYDRSRVEPTDASFREAAEFARDGGFDGYVSVGGGSSIDTAKAANLYATYPDDFGAYVNAPAGAAKPVPGPLRPHIACPTTSGTGAEVTGIAIFDYLELHAKTGIASRRLRPDLAVVDPDCTLTLPRTVVACSGFDVLSHALESYTALPYVRRPQPASPAQRPMSQGANPFSDLACLEALRIIGEFLVRAVDDASDGEARERMMYAATLAGIGFGNAGVQIPHAMAYAVAGLARAYHAPGYPGVEPLVPHGMAVILNTPSAVRFTAETDPARHLRAAALLGADVSGAAPTDAGEVLGARLQALMRATDMPNGLHGVGFAPSDVPALREGTLPQQRLLGNAPRTTGAAALDGLFARAMHYW